MGHGGGRVGVGEGLVGGGVVADEVEGSEGLGELGLEVGFGVGGDAFLFGELVLEGGEVVDVGGVVGDFYGEAFFGELVDASASALGEVFEEGGLVWGEVELPSVGRVEVFGLDEAGFGYYLSV